MTHSGHAHPGIGRLAPSPTGLLHLGHARSFLIAWWHARSRGSRLCLRFEDLDSARSSAPFAAATERDLRWLGLDWDGPIRVQSEHIEAILNAAQDLVERGLAYPCVCSRGEINALSAPHGADGEARYPGTCRGRYASLADALGQTGRAAGIRFKAPDEWFEFEDGCAGMQRGNPEHDAGDFLIVRRDGTPAYQLAVVVDDAAQGVSEVVRGNDLLSSTPRQLALLAALGLPKPSYWHIPLVTDATGQRLAKRALALGLETLRTAGAEPQRIVAWAANSCGLDVGPSARVEDVTQRFDIAMLSKSNVAIDETEMQSWLSG